MRKITFLCMLFLLCGMGMTMAQTLDDAALKQAELRKQQSKVKKGIDKPFSLKAIKGPFSEDEIAQSVQNLQIGTTVLEAPVSRGAVSNGPAGTATQNAGRGNTRANVTITNSASQTIETGIGCNSGGTFLDTNYYRNYELGADFGITSDFVVSSVEFAVFQSAPAGPSFPLTINIWSTPAGSFPGGPLTLVNSVGYESTSADTGTIVSVPVDALIPAGEAMVFEIAGVGDGSSTFFIGTNDDGQTQPSWIVAPACGVNSITDLGAFSSQMYVMNVVGEPLTQCGVPLGQPIPAVGTSGPMDPSIVTMDGCGIMGSNYEISSVDLDLNHTFDGDLEITLTSPAGTVLMLSDQNGGAGDNYTNTVFMDGGGDITAGTPPFTGTFQPQGGTFAAAFDGEPFAGDWVLNIQDQFGGDSGMLNNFCINFNQVSPNQPPSIVCPMDVNASTDPGECGAVVNYADAIAFDPEGGMVTVVQTSPDPAVLASGDEFPEGVTVVEFTATDECGATSTCSFTVTVTDNEDPEITCMDITVELDATGNVTVSTADVATATDNCGIASVEFGGQTMGALNTGFTNGNGAAGNMFDMMAINDLTMDSFDVNLEPFGGSPGAGDHEVFVYWKPGTFVGFETDAAAWTLAGSALVTSQGQNVPTPLNLNMGVSINAGDTVAWFIVTVTTSAIDYTNGGTVGDLWASDANMEIYEGAGRGQNAGDPFAGSVFTTRNVNAIARYSQGTPPSTTLDYTCADVGVNTEMVTVTDTNGNTATCMTNITVEDNIAPVIACIGEPTAVTDTASDSPAVAIPDDDPVGVSTTLTVADSQTITDLDVNLDISHTWVGDLQVMLESPAGTQVMIIDRPGVPATGFGCSGDDIDATLDDEATDPVEDECDAGVPTISGSFTPNEALSAFDGEDTAGDWILTVIDNAGGDTGTINEWGISYTYDASGTPLEVDLDANGMATINASDLLLSVDEACGWTATVDSAGAPMSLETTFAGGNSFNGNMFDINALNDITIDSFDVNIAAGTTDDIEVYFKTGTFVGSETDPTPWTLIGTAAGITSAGDGVPTPLNLSLGQAVSAGETVAFYVTTVNGGTMNYTNGTAVGSVFASDANLEFLEGNGGGYPFNVTFSPRVWNGNIHYTPGGGMSTTLDLDCSNLGANQIEVTVTDDSGNVSTCIATVNVNDVTDPILVCQDVTIELDENGMAEVDPAALLANMPGTFEVVTISSDNGSAAEGFTDFTMTVTDAATVSFDWDYSTMDGPQFDSFGYLLNGTYTELTDPAGALNQSGNSGAINVAPGDVFGFRSQSLDGLFGAATTVVSNFMPGFTGQFEPANWTLDLTNSDGDAFFVEIPGGPLSFDACGITVLAVDVTDVSCADIGTPITATVFASDASGNLASCTSVITVVDALGPEITCPADQTVDPGPGNLFYEVPDYWALGEATATDNCTDPVTITSQDPAAGDLIPDGVYTVTITAEDEYGNVSTCTFELTVESVLGIDDNTLDSAIAIYPNPADNEVTIANSSNILLEAANIYDINGKLIQSIDLSEMIQEQTIDVSALSSGVYVVHILGEEAATVKRLIKE